MSLDRSDKLAFTKEEVDNICDEYGEEIQHLKQWIADLQSGMYVNCVYCGHRYGPAERTPESKADQLNAHIEVCPEHPMSKLKAELETLKAAKISEACRRCRISARAWRSRTKP